VEGVILTPCLERDFFIGVCFVLSPSSICILSGLPGWISVFPWPRQFCNAIDFTTVGPVARRRFLDFSCIHCCN
jgi:hypothetical protein